MAKASKRLALDENAGEKRLILGFTIEGFTGSGAERYAKDNGIRFVPLDHEFQVGSSETVGGNIYVITSSKTVRFKRPLSKKITRIKVPKKIKINRKSYKVTRIVCADPERYWRV